ncbi:dihydroorotate dehydrogenase [Stenotrophomonas sp. HMSC10F06]|uniref:divalent-cation tolerance protein CutA n=1 Tax=Stenotrophomonas sp. HMSC10F06 TaxID=1581081 RepID=UPI0008A2F718|nr:divalent-cation tolerance protein CutA [Stenotrophomonas sp. HMSC10F06]OFS93189.1 dihydroorotate dehydrogenase [Stenotrophomonas sp. HMSC10F06]
MSIADPVFLLFTTCPDVACATRLAHALVDERLAACVTRLDGAHSTYRWQAEVTEDHEVQLVIKTTGSRLDAAIARVQALHPYELPECIAVETRAGLPAYLDWIRAQTREESD